MLEHRKKGISVLNIIKRLFKNIIKVLTLSELLMGLEMGLCRCSDSNVAIILSITSLIEGKHISDEANVPRSEDLVNIK